MFQRLKDTFAFNAQFSSWERLSQIPSALIGNRVAEMHGHSASYGYEFDVYLMRELYERLRPSAITDAKHAGLSSRQAALLLLCALGDEYTRLKGLKTPPETIIFSVAMLLPYPGVGLIPDHWRQFVEEARAQWRKRFEEQEAAKPLIALARKEAKATFREYFSVLGNMEFHQDLVNLWAKIPSSGQMTEREISAKCKLPLASVISWLEVLRARGVVTIIGTALDEPKFWKTPLSAIRPEVRYLREHLDLMTSS